jgi:hypothetical protein
MPAQRRTDGKFPARRYSSIYRPVIDVFSNKRSARKGCLPERFDFYLKIRIKREQGERFTVASVEHDTRPKRETLGLQHGHVLLTHFIKRVHQPLATWIEMKSLDKGGRPADVARSYLIYQLAEAAPDIIGKPATGATTGRFVDLCTAVLVACGLPEAGIEKAIPPVVRKLQANQGKRRRTARS